jgi:hypothetical protein
MNWKSTKDIDWTMLETRLSAKLDRLFEAPPNPQPKFDLLFWIDTNRGLNFDVYQKLPDDKQIRFGDIVDGWNSEIADLDDLFVNLLEEIDEDEDEEAEEKMDARLKDIVKRKCEELAKKNFGYPEGTPISWRIK